MQINAKKIACVGGVIAIAGAGFMGSSNLKKMMFDSSQQVAQQEEKIIEENSSAVNVVTGVEKQRGIAFERRIHTVAAGDTLSEIAQDYNVDIETLYAANPDLTELIHPGDEIIILPDKGAFYEVKSGDTLWQIGKNFEVTVEEIVKANKKATEHIAVGEKLFIPGARYARVNQERAEPAVARAQFKRFIWPASGEFSSPFGQRWGRVHCGIDIANEEGTNVVAAAAGKIIWAGTKGGYGHAVMIAHGNGFVTLYGHLSKSFVKQGQNVRAGQKIAAMGNTGNSTGPHLHFEILKNDEPVNPLVYLP